MSSSKTETARQRLKVLEQSQDGFSLRRWIRGPKCWVLVNLDYQTSPEFGGRPRGFGLAREAAEKVIARDESLSCAGGRSIGMSG